MLHLLSLAEVLGKGIKKLSGNDAQQTEGWRPPYTFHMEPLIKLITAMEWSARVQSVQYPSFIAIETFFIH